MHGFFLENTHTHVAYILEKTHTDAAALGIANSGGAFVVRASQATKGTV